MVPSTSQVPQPLPRVLYSLHIDDEEPISCVVRIRDNDVTLPVLRNASRDDLENGMAASGGDKVGHTSENEPAIFPFERPSASSGEY